MTRRGWVVAVALAGVACSSPRAGGLAGDIPDVPDAGDELPDGLVVPEDAIVLPPLVPATPAFEEERAETSWQADLLLDGDPRVVANDVLGQLRARGMSTVAACSGTRCTVTGRRSEGDLVLEQVRLDLLRPTSDDDIWSFSTLAYTRWRRPGAPHPNPTLGDAPELARPPLPRAAEPPDIPTEVFPAVLGVELEVVDGSEVIAPVTDHQCEDGAFAAHLAVEGDVDEVVDGYQAQLDDVDWYRLERSEEQFLGQRVVALRGEGPRIDRQHRDAPVELWVTEDGDDGPSWARLSWTTPCSD